jgi:hypothetical protein
LEKQFYTHYTIDGSERRFRLIYDVVGKASEMGYVAGFRAAPDSKGVLAILVLPEEGQVAWYLREVPVETDDPKAFSKNDERCDSFVAKNACEEVSLFPDAK